MLKLTVSPSYPMHSMSLRASQVLRKLPPQPCKAILQHREGTKVTRLRKEMTGPAEEHRRLPGFLGAGVFDRETLGYLEKLNPITENKWQL